MALEVDSHLFQTSLHPLSCACLGNSKDLGYFGVRAFLEVTKKDCVAVPILERREGVVDEGIDRLPFGFALGRADRCLFHQGLLLLPPSLFRPVDIF